VTARFVRQAWQVGNLEVRGVLVYASASGVPVETGLGSGPNVPDAWNTVVNVNRRPWRVTGTIVGLLIALAGIAFIRYSLNTPPDAIAMNRVAAGVVLGVPLFAFGLCIAVGASLGRMGPGIVSGFVLGPGLVIAYLFWTAR
jgi:hypothetical protein